MKPPDVPLRAPACPTHTRLGLCVSGRTNISDDLRDLLLKMLDKNPESRITIPQMKVKVEGRRSSGFLTFWQHQCRKTCCSTG